MKDTFNLRKFLTENKLNETSSKVLTDKTETRWIVLDKDGNQPDYFKKNFYTSPKRAQNTIDDIVQDYKDLASRKKADEPNLMKSDDERKADYERVSQYKVHEVELKMTVTLK